MFEHGKTKQVYHSVREKLKYYKKRVNDKSLTEGQREYAKQRIGELNAIDMQDYSVPQIVVTDDKHFGNGISKPRLCVAIKGDNKGRVLVAPLIYANSKQVILDNDINRQISKTSDGMNKWLDRSDIYEDKYITPHATLTERDIAKIRRLYGDNKKQ